MDTRGTPGNEINEMTFTNTLQCLVYLCGVNCALNDVEDGDVTTFLRRGRNHDVFLLCQTTHDIQHRCLAYCGGCNLREHDGCVTGHEEMATRGGDEGGDEADEVVVHVTGITQRRRRRGHHCRDERVQLTYSRVGKFQTVDGDAVEGGVVEDDDGIGIQR